MGAPSGCEQRHSGDDKDDLCRSAGRDVDNRACGRLRRRNAALVHELRAHEVTAYASDRQQGVDGFAESSASEQS